MILAQPGTSKSMRKKRYSNFGKGGFGATESSIVWHIAPCNSITVIHYRGHIDFSFSVRKMYFVSIAGKHKMTNVHLLVVVHVWRLVFFLLARLHHLGDDLHQRSILKGCGNPLLVAQLLVNLISRAVGSFFDAYVDPEAWWEGLL